MELSPYELVDPRALPVPQDRPFRRAEAHEWGLTRHALHRCLHAGVLVSPLRGVYHVPHLADSLALRVACVRLVAPADAVITDRTAAWLQEAPMILEPNAHRVVPKVDLYLPPGRRSRRDLARSGERTFLARDLIEIGGLTVTGPLRTACDLGRLQLRDQAFACLDSLLRTGRVTRQELVAEATGARFRGYRGVRQLRALAPWADPRAESPGESVLRLRWLDCGDLPPPELQVEVNGPDGRCYLDLGLPDIGYGAEYDGEEWHGPEQAQHDTRRRKGIALLSGYEIDVLVRANVFGAQQNAEVILRAGVRRAMRRARGGRWLV